MEVWGIDVKKIILSVIIFAISVAIVLFGFGAMLLVLGFVKLALWHRKTK